MYKFFITLSKASALDKVGSIVKVLVRILDKTSATKSTYNVFIKRSEINKAHRKLKASLGVYFVNFSWDDGKSFICGMPHDMEIDEILIELGDMTFDEYMRKWYSMELTAK